MSQGVSPKSQKRHSLIKTYRLRGSEVRNLWLLYSVKMESDVLLGSDYQLIHWLCYLEANPNITQFTLTESEKGYKQENNQPAPYVIAMNRDGLAEWHYISSNVEEVKNTITKRDSMSSDQEKINYCFYSYAQLEACSKVALRWLSAISHAAVLRGQKQLELRNVLFDYFSTSSSGFVADLKSCTGGFDESIVLGMIVRLAIEGVIHLDLNKSTFGWKTSWSYHGKSRP